MRQRLARDLDAAEHARDLVAPRVAVEIFDAHLRRIPAARLHDAKVSMPERGNLRQVRHAEHLALRTKIAELAPNDFGDRAADAGIDFVEHHRADRIEAERRDFEREADARKLAARRDLAQRPRRRTWIRGDE